jgi:AmmeMemoRadiSam system protein A
MPSIEAADSASSGAGSALDEDGRRRLLDLAWSSIHRGFEDGAPIHVDPADYPHALRAPGACFVTLHRLGSLRGCIGHLTACQPLVSDVAENAFAAAFRDPRFEPLQPGELEGLSLDISVLTAPEPMRFRDEADLIAQIRPGLDGLILEDGWARGTFLPAVWESVPEPRRFLAELKRKAGLPGSHWSERLKISRYRTETFGG